MTRHLSRVRETGNSAKHLTWPLTWVLFLAVFALASGLADLPSALGQNQPELGMRGMAQGYTKGTVLGVQGYYEVTPSGAVILYPATPVTAPGVMHTILGMFGGTSMVGRRGYFQITPMGELFLYFPPGTPWPGMGGVQAAPGSPGVTGGAVQGTRQ